MCSKLCMKYCPTIKCHVQPPEQPISNSLFILTFTVDQIYAYYVITRKYYMQKKIHYVNCSSNCEETFEGEISKPIP